MQWLVCEAGGVHDSRDSGTSQSVLACAARFAACERNPIPQHAHDDNCCVLGRARLPQRIHFGVYAPQPAGINVSIVSFGDHCTFVDKHSTQSKRFWTFEGFGMREIDHRRSPHCWYIHLFLGHVTSLWVAATSIHGFQNTASVPRPWYTFPNIPHLLTAPCTMPSNTYDPA